MDIKTWRGGNDDQPAKVAEVDEVVRAAAEQARAMGPLPYQGSISPRVYLVGQVLTGLLAQTKPHGYSLDEISAMGGLAIDIADATLDAMMWPSGKPEEKR